MMLYWIWFVVLSAVGFIFGFFATKELDEGEDTTKPFLGFGSMILALVISWEGVGGKLYGWLDTVLPMSGHPIHDFSAYAIIATMCLVWVFSAVGIYLLPSTFKD
jgi:hypothetical protein